MNVEFVAHSVELDDQIRQYMVDRYGEFVRYRPRFSGATAMLWLAPLVLLLIGLVVAIMTLRGRRQASAPEKLSEDEQRRLQALMDKADQ